MKRIIFLPVVLISLLLTNCTQSQSTSSGSKSTTTSDKKYPDPQIISGNATFPMHLTEAEWKKRLTPAQYYILREQGTESPFTGKLNHFYEKGTYYSAASLQPVFSSDTKFD